MSNSSALSVALSILKSNSFCIDDLPIDVNNTFAWNLLVTQFSLTVGQLCALQNFVSNKHLSLVAPTSATKKQTKKRANNKNKSISEFDLEKSTEMYEVVDCTGAGKSSSIVTVEKKYTPKKETLSKAKSYNSDDDYEFEQLPSSSAAHTNDQSVNPSAGNIINIHYFLFFLFN